MFKLFPAAGFSTRDPHVIFNKGKYYHCYTQDAASVSIRWADTVEGLANAPGTLVWKPEAGQAWSEHVWAPELHILDGKCYIYVAADDGDMSHHRMYVLENGADDPMQPYTLHGKITDPTDQYAIDGTVLEIGGERYYSWSGRERDDIFIQNIYIAKMADPYTLEGERVLLSTPEYDWEKLGGQGVKGRSYVNEGPYGYATQGRQFLFYSAAGSWCTDYCIAVLELVGEDPLDPKAWKKYPEKVFSCNSEVKGAGHCSLLPVEDKTYVFFHAWDAEETNIVWTATTSWCGELTFNNGTFVLE